jgi:hypothetical protein
MLSGAYRSGRFVLQELRQRRHRGRATSERDCCRESCFDRPVPLLGTGGRSSSQGVTLAQVARDDRAAL